MFFDKFSALCQKMGVSKSKAAESVGLNRTSVMKWKNGAVPSGATITKLAEYFGVSADYLLDNSDISPETQKAPTLNKKDERDIARRLEETLNLLESSDALMFDGEPLDQESMDLLKTSLQNQYTLAKKIAKQKFTPKKYRTDNENR